MAVPSPYTLLSLLLLLVFSLCLHTPQCFLAAAATLDDTLMEGQSLAIGEKLVSANGKFAFGFFQPAPTTTTAATSPNCTSGSRWYVGVWFNKVPVFTTVWVANRDEPITVDPCQARLKISNHSSNLAIETHVDTNAPVVVWSTHVVVNKTNASTSFLLLEKSGNLTLKSSKGDVLWQSFEYPTDVCLPGAKIGRNKVTGLNWLPISKKSRVDPGLGSYTIELGATAFRLQRRHNPSLVYWSFPLSSGPVLLQMLKGFAQSNPLTKDLVNPFYVDSSQEEYYGYTWPDDAAPMYVLLDISGQMKVNIWSQDSLSWVQAFNTIPLSVCTPSATCGPFTVCDGNTQPACKCMKSFSIKSLQDWEVDDRSEGCIRDTPLQCNTTGSTMTATDMFYPIAGVMLPYSEKVIDVAATQSKCEEACLASCDCTAYSYSNRRCNVWYGELLGVNLNQSSIGNNFEDLLYIRLSAKDLLSSTGNRRNTAVVAASTSCFGILLFIILVLVIYRRKKFKWCGLSSYENNQDGDNGGIIAFRYSDLVHATKNFSDKLGEGGFGSVYKGVLLSSDSVTTYIAVKRLDGVTQGEKQFRAEVSSIGLIHHINLIKMIGFCCEGNHRLLVYEHMQNGSLEGHLFSSNVAADAAVLSWDTRYKIALGVARGLSYLHQSCRNCIIHCDLKPENILLDASFVPKVADFGMAVFVGRDFSRVLTTFRGTIGYLAPEWLSGVAITPKIDTYSFGMVLLEIVSGRRNTAELCHTNKGGYHPDFFPVRAVGELLGGGDVGRLVDPRLHGDFNLQQAERVCKVASWCIQDDEIDRPEMGEVLLLLEGVQNIDLAPMPRLLAAFTELSDNEAGSTSQSTYIS